MQSHHALVEEARKELEQANKELEIAEQRVWILEMRLRDARRMSFRASRQEEEAWPEVEIETAVSRVLDVPPQESPVPLHLFDEETFPRISREETRIGMPPLRSPAPAARKPNQDRAP